MLDADAEDDGEEQKPDVNATDPTTEDIRPQREPRVSRKDKDLHTFLNQMDKYAPIVQCLLHFLLIFDPWCRHRILPLPGRFRMLGSTNVTSPILWTRANSIIENVYLLYVRKNSFLILLRTLTNFLKFVLQLLLQRLKCRKWVLGQEDQGRTRDEVCWLWRI